MQTELTATQIERRSSRLQATAAFAMAFASLAMASSGIVRARPPMFQWGWVFSWAFTLGAMSVAFAFARPPASLPVRVAVKVALLVSLAAAWISIQLYQANYHDYPWIAVALIVVMAVAGGWCFGQRELAIGVALFVGLWLGGGFLPAEALPQAVVHGDLRLTLLQRAEGKLLFRLQSLSGKELSRTVDLENTELEGSAGMLIPVEGWPLRAGQEGEPSDTYLFGRTFVPAWVRSWDATVSIPIWPDRAAASVTVPIPASAGASRVRARDSEGSVRLDVADVHWDTSAGEYPERLALVMRVDYSGTGHGGLSSQELRVTDDLGNVIPTSVRSMSSIQDGSSNRVQLGAIDPKAKSLRVDLFTDEQRGANVVRFTFSRVPN